MTGKQVWSVNFWGSHPDKREDNRWSGQDFGTEAEARALFDACTGVPLALKAERERYVLEHGEKAWADWIDDLTRSTPYVDLSASACKDAWSPENTREVGEVWCYLPPKADTNTDADHERMCQSEAAMQAGMAFGVDGYNDAMGFNLRHDEWD